MAPVLTVGLLGDLERREVPVAAELDRELRRISELLVKRGHAAHVEPLDAPLWEREVSSLELHCLRRLAAHVDLEGELPEPGDEDSVDADPVMDRYYELAGERRGFLVRMLSARPVRERRFDHLIVHRDDDGFYVPAEFDAPLDFESSVSGPGWVGSLPRLAAECAVLAERLEGAGAFAHERAALEALVEGCRRARDAGAVLAFA